MIRTIGLIMFNENNIQGYIVYYFTNDQLPSIRNFTDEPAYTFVNLGNNYDAALWLKFS